MLGLRRSHDKSTALRMHLFKNASSPITYAYATTSIKELISTASATTNGEPGTRKGGNGSGNR